MQDVKLLDKVIFPKFFESDMKWLLQTAASPYKCLNLIFNVCSFVLTFFILCKSLAYIAQVTNMNLFRQYITCIQVQYVFTSYKKANGAGWCLSSRGFHWAISKDRTQGWECLFSASHTAEHSQLHEE